MTMKKYKEVIEILHQTARSVIAGEVCPRTSTIT